MREHIHNHAIVPPEERLVQFLQVFIIEKRHATKGSVKPEVFDALAFYHMLVDKPQSNKHAEKLKSVFMLSVREADAKGMKVGPGCLYGSSCITVASMFMEWLTVANYPYPSWVNTMSIAVAFDTMVRNVKVSDPAFMTIGPGINAGNITGLTFFDRNAERLNQIKGLISEIQQDFLTTSNYSPDDSTFVVMTIAYMDQAAHSVQHSLDVLRPKLTAPEK